MPTMDRKSISSTTAVIEALGEKLPSINFYRFCQLIEQAHKTHSPLGSTQSPQADLFAFVRTVEWGFQ